MAAAAGGLAIAGTQAALAQVTAAPVGAQAAGSFLQVLTGRLEHTIQHIPSLNEHLARLPGIVGGRSAVLLIGMVLAGMAAEYLARLILQRAFPPGHMTCPGEPSDGRPCWNS